jgi:hypothetical protein
MSYTAVCKLMALGGFPYLDGALEEVHALVFG